MNLTLGDFIWQELVQFAQYGKYSNRSGRVLLNRIERR